MLAPQRPNGRRKCRWLNTTQPYNRPALRRAASSFLFQTITRQKEEGDRADMPFRRRQRSSSFAVNKELAAAALAYKRAQAAANWRMVARDRGFPGLVRLARSACHRSPADARRLITANVDRIEWRAARGQTTENQRFQSPVTHLCTEARVKTKQSKDID